MKWQEFRIRLIHTFNSHRIQNIESLIYLPNYYPAMSNLSIWPQFLIVFHSRHCTDRPATIAVSMLQRIDSSCKYLRNEIVVRFIAIKYSMRKKKKKIKDDVLGPDSSLILFWKLHRITTCRVIGKAVKDAAPHSRH